MKKTKSVEKPESPSIQDGISPLKKLTAEEQAVLDRVMAEKPDWCVAIYLRKKRYSR